MILKCFSLFILLTSLVFGFSYSETYAGYCSKKDALPSDQILKRVGGAISHAFNRNKVDINGLGSMKYIYVVNQDGKVGDIKSNQCYAYAISQARSEAIIKKELQLLRRLKEDGLPVVNFYESHSVEESMIFSKDSTGQQDVGYLMDWIPNAVQLEAKTQNKPLTISTLIAILIGEGKTLDSREFGRIRNIQNVKSLLTRGVAFRVNEKALDQMLEALIKMATYTHNIIDLQFLIDVDSGQITLIDPMELMTDAQVASDPDLQLRNHVAITKKWLGEMIKFLLSTKDELSRKGDLRSSFLKALE